MGFNAFVPDDESRIESMGAMNPVTELTPDGMFSGTGGAAVRGVVGGAAAVGRTLYDFLGEANKSSVLQYDDTANPAQVLADQTQMSPQLDEALKRTQEWAKIDPRVAGPGAQTIGSLAHGLTVFGLGTLAGGPVAGAGLTGATEGYNDYRDAIAAGVDPQTAAEKAFGTGAFAAAGAFLPMKFGGIGVKGLAASMAGGAAVNTGFGVAQRYLSSEILAANGYKDMAAQYRPLDAQSMAADALLGLAFGGFAHAMHGSDIPAAQRPTPDLIEQALDARRQDAVERGGPGIPIDPEHATMNVDLQDQALGNLLRGKPVDVQPEQAAAIVDHSVIDPERVELNNAYQEAGIAVHGDLANFSEPARVEQPIAPYPVPEVQTAAPATGAEANPQGASGISPVARETLDQLALRHPDLEVELPDGRTVRAADMQSALQQDMRAATRDSRLLDVAVGCFLRTMV